jgi:hypothetical protein
MYENVALYIGFAQFPLALKFMTFSRFPALYFNSLKLNYVIMLDKCRAHVAMKLQKNSMTRSTVINKNVSFPLKKSEKSNFNLIYGDIV